MYSILLTLYAVQQEIHPVLVVAEGCLVVFVDLSVQSHADLLSCLQQVVSLCHGWFRPLQVQMGLAQ